MEIEKKKRFVYNGVTE